MNVPTGEFQILHEDLKEVKHTMQRVASETVLTANRVGVLENRMNRSDSGAKRLEEVTKETDTKLDQAIGQNAQILLALEIAKADREATIRTVKWIAGLGAVAFPALMWLIQHGASK